MSLYDEIRNIFRQGMKFSNVEVREILRKLYKQYQIEKSPKSTDLKLFGLKTKRAIVNKQDKRMEGVKILK